MTSTSSPGARSVRQGTTAQHQGSGSTQAKHVHHGRTLAAWVGSIVALVGFIVGGIGFVIPPHPNWIVVVIGAVLLVASLVATVVLRKLGHGAD
ncbi:MAG TPA: DUF202 domain-containing protein [Microlunatus sp.]|nr:DUF202 domain-containing protein [Microlunatus sp.]